MALAERFRSIIDAILGVSTYEAPPVNTGVTLESVGDIRKAMGGNIQPLPNTRLRWYLKDLETAQAEADNGYLHTPAQLYRALRRDGVYTGLMSTRTDGLVRLPKRFYPDGEVADVLRSRNGTRSVFDEMCPPAELALMAADGIALGISVGELRPVKGRTFPVLVRLEPEFLQYRWSENRWYFNSVAGSLPITPGDGRWVLHVPGGRLNPWNWGQWPALGRSFINKEHAISHRSNYSAKLANPARVAYAPIGATELQRKNFFRKILAWATNTVLEMPVGWEAKILESNGRGWEVFQREIDTSDNEFMVTLCGQVVTVTGGSGFANADIHATIRRDLITATGETLAYTVNTQILPWFIATHWGEEAVHTPTVVEWDTSTPADREKEAKTLGDVGTAIATLNEALGPYGKRVNAGEIAVRWNVPLEEAPIVVQPSESADKETPT